VVPYLLRRDVGQRGGGMAERRPTDEASTRARAVAEERGEVGVGQPGKQREGTPIVEQGAGLPTKVKREGGRERGVGGSKDGRRRRMGGGGGRRVGCWEGLGLGEWMDIYWTLSAS
jgi:hypothetical protein